VPLAPRAGEFNVLVCTCIGEEGLDIGTVDLIVCYDTVQAPTRLVQRLGRTGRHRAGRCVVLVNEVQHAARSSSLATCLFLAALSAPSRACSPSRPRLRVRWARSRGSAPRPPRHASH
jgi:superfamily II DNA/RNA helicase